MEITKSNKKIHNFNNHLVAQEYAISNTPRVSLNPLSDEPQAMRGRGEGGDAHELTRSITKTSQKSLMGLALGEMG